jgi:hypothetical protein
MVACSNGHTDIVKLLLAVPGVDVNAAKVSCVSGKRLHDGISHLHVRSLRACCVQDGCVWGRAILEVDCVSGGLWPALLCAGRWADSSHGCLFEWSHGHREAAAGDTLLERPCR